MLPKIIREKDIVKFSDCPKEFEIDINLLRKKIKKFVEIPELENEKAKEFVQFYRDLINEKTEKHLNWLFEIFKFIRTRSVRFVPPLSATDYPIGKPIFMKWCIRNYLTLSGGQPFSFFCSTYHVKHTHKGHPVDVKTELDEPYAFDMVIDQDPPKAWERTKKIAEYLTGITPIHVVFSGRGFHIWITYNNLIENFNVKKQETYTNQEIKEIYKKIENDIVKHTKVKEIGHGGREKQMIRVIYTLSDKTNLVCLPLDEKQFYNFKPEMARIDEVFKLNIRDRGMPRIK